MRKFLIYLLSLLMSAAACSEVDPVIDDEDDKGAEVVNPDDEPDDETDGETVMIYDVKVYDESGGVAHYVYDYDDSGRVTKIVDAASDEMIMQYRYEDDLVRVGGITGEYIVTLDDKGRIHDTSVAGEDMTLIWSYGMNGYVNGVTVSPETWSCRIVNRMGNFTDVPSLGDEELTYISYTDHLSRYSIDLWNNPVFGFNENILCYTLGVRAKGVISRNLPSSYKYYGDEWRFSYTFDDEGNVSVMEMSCNDELVRTVYFDCGYGFPDDMPESDENDDDTQEAKTKLVASLMGDFYAEGEKLIVTFEYDGKNRLTRSFEKYYYYEDDYWDDFFCRYFLYDDSNREMTELWAKNFNLDEGPESVPKREVGRYVFDNSGLLKEKYTPAGFYVYNCDMYYTFEYKDDKISNICEYELPDKDFYCKYEYIWRDGNLFSWIRTIGSVYAKEYDEYEYDEHENRCNIDFYYYSYSDAIRYFDQYPFSFDRTLFKEFFDKNLVKRAGDSFYHYEFDEDGYPVKMIVYENGELYEEMTIEYYE